MNIIVLNSCVFVLFFMIIRISLSQIEETTTTEAPSNAICNLCACAENEVDCSNRNISQPFELIEWEGLQSFQPKKVDLSQNLLTEITRISRLPIQVLNLSSCAISVLEDASFIYLEDLVSMDLSRNKIATSALNRRVFSGPLEIDSGPKPFAKLTTLSLGFNDLHSLPPDIFMFMPGLTSLDLSGNPLAYIDQVTMGAISELLYLRELKLSGCELETLPDGLLRRQRKLRRLDISDNRFTTVPSVLQEAPNLVYLNFDKNSLQSIDSRTSISNLTKLQELSMSRMSRLQNISANALGGLSSLEVLWLNYNPRLTNLSPAFLIWKDDDGDDQWPDLRELYMNNNNLSTISSHTLDGWNDLVAADFSNNPYVCDCNSQWMVDVLVPLLVNTPGNTSTANMICKKPMDVKGLTFQQLSDASKTLVCAESENMTEQPVANLAILLGVMIGIITTFPLVLILVLLWRRGYFARCRGKKNYDEDYDDEAENL